ncbi:MAG: bifunctional diguanylate cyclase/phosphodiesterase [Solirubrobacteraceae bacterium]|nr:bifunctional diguanylate cyclase/phosphodiesterase [Solirubrobacteraceae bacterium]
MSRTDARTTLESAGVPRARVSSSRLLRAAIAFVAAGVVASAMIVPDWHEIVPAAPKGLLAVLMACAALIFASAMLRDRQTLGVYRWAPPLVAAAIAWGVIAWIFGGDVGSTAHLAMAQLAGLAALVTSGRRPYDGIHRLEAIAIVYSLAALLSFVLPVEDWLQDLGVDQLVMVVTSIIIVGSTTALVLSQGWKPSPGVALFLLGAVLLFGAQMFAVAGADPDPRPLVPLEVLALAALMGGAIFGDPGLPAAQRAWITNAAMFISTVIAFGVLVLHGRDTGGGILSDTLGVVVLCAVFGRALAPSSRPPRTDPSEIGGIDRLTGLPDRYELEAVLEREIELADHRRMPVAVAVLSVENLHEINETLGHRVGDEVLREFAARLAGNSGADVPVRLAGNTFALVLRSHTSEREARRALEQLTSRLETPLQVDGVALAAQVRTGLVFFPAHGRTVGELLQRAEIAAQEAKDRRVALMIYDPARDLRSRERLLFAAQLREGIDRDELRVFFQPKIDLETAQVVGAEALVRWRHPEEGLLLPDRFLSVAERTGQMGALTQWVLAASLREVQRWRSHGFGLHVAVNLSPQNLADVNLPARLAELLDRHGVVGSALRLEVTEDVAMADPARTAEVIRAINELGILVALDDFGTGYSSLAHLKHLNCDELKIDRSFVRDIVTDEDDRVIVWSTLDLARNLGMRTVAEGIESPETVQMLAMMGCSMGQGFHYAHPLDADAFLAWCVDQHRLDQVRLMRPLEQPLTGQHDVANLNTAEAGPARPRTFSRDHNKRATDPKPGQPEATGSAPA